MSTGQPCVIRRKYMLHSLGTVKHVLKVYKLKLLLNFIVIVLLKIHYAGKKLQNIVPLSDD